MSADPEPEQLPPAVALAWGIGDRPRRGPKPALNLERILEAAAEVCDVEGLEALSMSRLAKQTGFTTMAVYRHVQSKDDLLVLLLERLIGLPPAVSGEDWRADLEAWARAMLATFRRHPWVVKIPITGLPMTPNQVAWMEACLAATRGTSLTENERASVLLLTSGLVRNQASLEYDLMRARMFAAGEHGDAQMRQYSSLLRRLTAGGPFPALTEIIDAEVFDRADPPDAEFDFGLARLLDGVQTLIASRA